MKPAGEPAREKGGIAPATGRAAEPGPVRRVIRGLRSLRFAIILMALIAVACLVGTLVEQRPYDPNEAIAQHGQALGLLIGLLGLNHLYAAWWFLGLLGLLALSIAVCAFSGARLSLRKIFSLIAHASILLIVAGAIVRCVAAVDGYVALEKGETTDVLHVAGRILVDYSYVGPRGEQSVEKENHVLSVSEPTFLKCPNVVPDSIIVTDGSGARTYKPSVDYDAVVMADQTGLQYTGIMGLQTGATNALPLGCKVRLDNFVIRYYEGTGESLEVRHGKAGQARSFPVEVGEIVLLSDGVKVEVLQRVLNFKMDENHKVYSASDEPENPAVQVRVTSPAGESKRWVFAKHPEFSQMQGHAADTTGLEITYIFGPPPAVKSYESHVTLLDENGNKVREAVILVNAPLKLGRYTLYQASYTKSSGTILEVTSDPGVPLVFAGFILLPLGVALAFYVKPLLNRAAAKS